MVIVACCLQTAGSERDGEARGGKSSKDLVREDLEKLTAAARDDTQAADEEEDEDEEMPPLLQVSTPDQSLTTLDNTQEIKLNMKNI